MTESIGASPEALREAARRMYAISREWKGRAEREEVSLYARHLVRRARDLEADLTHDTDCDCDVCADSAHEREMDSRIARERDERRTA